MVEKGVVKLQYIATDEQIVDVLTKPLSRVKLEYFRDNLGVVPRVMMERLVLVTESITMCGTLG